jgi:hypothetical protein
MITTPVVFIVYVFMFEARPVCLLYLFPFISLAFINSLVFTILHDHLDKDCDGLV